jgi:SAM-dependent methyltransferase
MNESRRRGRLAVLLVFVGLSTLALVWWSSEAVRRFMKRQFPELEVKPTGWFATAYSRMVPWMGEWLYSIFAKRLDLTADDEVLDIACGSGTFLRKHASHVRRVAGLDHADDLIEIAKRENQERVNDGTAQFVVGDATDLPWGDSEFNVVTCNCIDCFAAKSRSALEEMYRVLRPGGRILVADDHRKEMEEIGFTGVSVEHVLWGDLTSASKQAV